MKFAILGGGMVGACYMQAFLEHGHQLAGLCELQPNAAVAHSVQAAGAQVHTAPGTWLAGADVVVSAVFGGVAGGLFEACLPHLHDGALYVDMTAADPQEMRECGELVQRGAQGKAVHFVDVAITGAVNLGGSKTPLLVAGGKAGFVQKLFLPFGGSVRGGGAGPGEAAVRSAPGHRRDTVAHADGIHGAHPYLALRTPPQRGGGGAAADSPVRPGATGLTGR